MPAVCERLRAWAGISRIVPLVTDDPTQVAVPIRTPTRRRPAPAPDRADPLQGRCPRGRARPGPGCFRFQVIVLAVLIVLTPLSVAWDWPPMVSAALLFVVIFLLLVTGQTIIFLLRLVAADRRGRRRPLASGTKTVGELEGRGRQRRARVMAAASAGDRTDAARDSAGADLRQRIVDPERYRRRFARHVRPPLVHG